MDKIIPGAYGVHVSVATQRQVPTIRMVQKTVEVFLQLQCPRLLSRPRFFPSSWPDCALSLPCFDVTGKSLPRWRRALSQEANTVGDLERYEKQTAALLERAPPAASRNRREWQKLVVRITHSSFTTVKSCKLPRNSLLLPCESCKRSANMLYTKHLIGSEEKPRHKH